MRISDWSSDVCSSDLRRVDGVREEVAAVARFRNCRHSTSMLLPPKLRPVSDGNQCPRWWGGYSRAAGRKSSLSSRSEEHTSELQSLMRISYAVFCWTKKSTKQSKAHICTPVTHAKHTLRMLDIETPA